LRDCKKKVDPKIRGPGKQNTGQNGRVGRRSLAALADTRKKVTGEERGGGLRYRPEREARGNRGDNERVGKENQKLSGEKKKGKSQTYGPKKKKQGRPGVIRRRESGKTTGIEWKSSRAHCESLTWGKGIFWGKGGHGASRVRKARKERSGAVQGFHQGKNIRILGGKVTRNGPGW